MVVRYTVSQSSLCGPPLSRVKNRLYSKPMSFDFRASPRRRSDSKPGSPAGQSLSPKQKYRRRLSQTLQHEHLTQAASLSLEEIRRLCRQLPIQNAMAACGVEVRPRWEHCSPCHFSLLMCVCSSIYNRFLTCCRLGWT